MIGTGRLRREGRAYARQRVRACTTVYTREFIRAREGDHRRQTMRGSTTRRRRRLRSRSRSTAFRCRDVRVVRQFRPGPVAAFKSQPARADRIATRPTLFFRTANTRRADRDGRRALRAREGRQESSRRRGKGSRLTDAAAHRALESRATTGATVLDSRSRKRFRPRGVRPRLRSVGAGSDPHRGSDPENGCRADSRPRAASATAPTAGDRRVIPSPPATSRPPAAAAAAHREAQPRPSRAIRCTRERSPGSPRARRRCRPVCKGRAAACIDVPRLPSGCAVVACRRPQYHVRRNGHEIAC